MVYWFPIRDSAAGQLSVRAGLRTYGGEAYELAIGTADIDVGRWPT